MLAIIIAMSHVVGAQALDYDMSAQERKQTGVFRLSDKEKAALQTWIDTHYEKRSQPIAQEAAQQQKSMLQENLRSGRYLRLADGSLWSIHPSDTNIALGWITPVDIIITQSGDSAYPYKLTNSLTGSSIRAKKVQELPKVAPPAPAPTNPTTPAAPPKQ